MSKITPQQIMDALKSAHAECEGARDNGGHCIHVDALNDEQVNDAVQAYTEQAIQSGIEILGDPVFSVFFAGLHLGYRLNQVVQEQQAKEAVN